MAANVIAINTNFTISRQLFEVVNNLRTVQEKLPGVLAILNSYINGADYTALENAMGLAAGQGVVLVTLVTNANNTMSGAGLLSQFSAWINPQI